MADTPITTASPPPDLAAITRRYDEASNYPASPSVLDSLRDVPALLAECERRKDFDFLKERFTEMCEKLRTVVEKYHLGLGGEHLDDLVVEEIERGRRIEDAARRCADAARKACGEGLWDGLTPEETDLLIALGEDSR